MFIVIFLCTNGLKKVFILSTAEPVPCRLLQQVVVSVQLLSDLGVNLETKMNTSSVTEFHGVCE